MNFSVAPKLGELSLRILHRGKDGEVKGEYTITGPAPGTPEEIKQMFPPGIPFKVVKKEEE